MSYAQAMKWGKKHPKGTRQTVIMSTGSGFWPSYSYLVGKYFPYREACERIGVEPLECRKHYNATIRGGSIAGMSLEEQAEWTKNQVACGIPTLCPDDLIRPCDSHLTMLVTAQEVNNGSNTSSLMFVPPRG